LASRSSVKGYEVDWNTRVYYSAIVITRRGHRHGTIEHYGQRTMTKSAGWQYRQDTQIRRVPNMDNETLRRADNKPSILCTPSSMRKIITTLKLNASVMLEVKSSPNVACARCFRSPACFRPSCCAQCSCRLCETRQSRSGR
jgi:hypothetical protein